MNVNGDETEQRLAAWHALVSRVAAVEKQLPPEYGNAGFELLGYPVRAAAAANEKGLALTRYYEYSAQGRLAVESYLAAASQAQDEIERLTDRYNHQLAGGKWNLMMSAHPRKLAVFDRPKIPQLEIPWSPPRLGLMVEGAARSVFANQTNVVSGLPQFNALLPQSHFVDVFNGGNGPLNWTATASADWLQLSATSGTNDTRVRASIDWMRAPKGEAVSAEIIFAANGQKLAVGVTVFHPANPAQITVGVDFIEADHCVVMSASHASEWLPGRSTVGRKVTGLGYQGTVVTTSSTLAAGRDEPQPLVSESPCWKYHLWLQHAGDWLVTVRALPTFPVLTSQPQRYAIALDNQPPQLIALPAGKGENDRQWQEDVLRNAVLTTSKHSVAAPGKHTLKIWLVDPGLVLDNIAAEQGHGKNLGYTWPAETAPHALK